ncbi:MAG: DNA polymerase III subunit delta' [Clostridiales bacterium]|nr:DNA polymerase III subunit delta' [Clostridiales bacterium]
MSDLKDILGNERLKNHFRAAVEQQKVSHAYIIEGEKGSGKKAIASAFAKVLQCEHKNEQKKYISDMDACGKCESCIQMEHKNHPDVLWITHEKPNVISVQEVRSQIVNSIEIMPYKGPYKIYIIDEAEKMNASAQNALLKSIEEPPWYAVILLLTSNRGAFLPTILSRCILLTVKPVSNALVNEYLTEQYHIEKETAEFCAEFSMGNIGKALNMALSEDFKMMRDFSVSFLRYIHEMEPFEIDEKVKQLKNWKESVDDFLDFILIWCRDILMIKIRDDKDILIFREEYPYIKKQSEIACYEGLNKIFLKIDQTRMRIRFNVNYDLSLDVLLMDIRNIFIYK